MHELSVALSLVDVVVERLVESGATRVRRVVVEVGDLSGVVPAALQSAFRVASDAEAAVRGARLELVAVAVVLHCDKCSADRPAVGAAALRCADCGTPSMNVVRGRELEVITIEVDDAATPA